MANDDRYQQKKDREIAWYEKNSDSNRTLAGRILNSPVFYTKERNAFYYNHCRKQMHDVLTRFLGQRKVDRLLIAPCGVGNDYKYLSDIAVEVHGIDLAAAAIERCPGEMKTRVGDILNSGYPEAMFDVIASPNFFHHLLKIGFDPFVTEFFRILKPGGVIIILEPSLWYPLNLITRPLKHIFNNPYGEVDDEGPFNPKRLLNSLERVGFHNIDMQAASFSHPAYYLPLAKTINTVMRPLMNVGLLAYISSTVIYLSRR